MEVHVQLLGPTQGRPDRQLRTERKKLEPVSNTTTTTTNNFYWTLSERALLKPGELYLLWQQTVQETSERELRVGLRRGVVNRSPLPACVERRQRSETSAVWSFRVSFARGCETTSDTPYGAGPTPFDEGGLEGGLKGRTLEGGLEGQAEAGLRGRGGSEGSKASRGA